MQTITHRNNLSKTKNQWSLNHNLRLFFVLTILMLTIRTIYSAANGMPVGFNNQQNRDSMAVEFYPIPSADEILEYIDRNSLSYKSGLLINRRNVELYNSSYEKRIGFGLYMANLAYALGFDQTGTALSYFEVIEKMGGDLDLFPREIESISQRFINNIGRHDSLKALYTESYILMIDHLGETSNMGSYAIISAGSFVESIYFALNSVQSQHENDAFRLRIWNQKLVLEQLWKVADRHLDRVQKEQLFSDLAGVKRIFDSYTERPRPVKRETKPDGTIVLGQKSELETLKPASVQELKIEIDLLRKKWVKR